MSVSVSIENIVTDVHELEKGMDQVRKESDLRGKGVHSVILRDFLLNSEEKLKRLKADAKSSQDVFRECVEYFGESHRTTDANTFFSLLVRFARAFKVNIHLLTFLIIVDLIRQLDAIKYLFFVIECFKSMRTLFF